MNAVKNDSLTFEDGINNKVKAGTQKVLQVFITNAANVFLLEPPASDGLLEEQVLDVLNYPRITYQFPGRIFWTIYFL